MRQVVYGDILFIINFSMDFLALFITGKLWHCGLKTSALTFASLIGALYAVINLFWDGNRAVAFCISIIVSALMCYIALGGKSLLSVIKHTFVFYLVNFLLGGAMTAIFNLLNSYRSRDRVLIGGNIGVIDTDIPFGLFIIIAAVSAVLSFIGGRIFKKSAAIKEAAVRANFDGREVVFNALVDSGNLLVEELSGKSVIITTFETLSEILPPELFPAFRDGLSSLGALDIAYIKRVRIIPVSSLCSSGIALGFLPDGVFVNGEPREAYIAISPGSDDNNSFGGLGGIVPSALLN